MRSDIQRKFEQHQQGMAAECLERLKAKRKAKALAILNRISLHYAQQGGVHIAAKFKIVSCVKLVVEDRQ